MKNKPYSVTGDKVNGHRIAVPESTGVKKGDRYTCTVVGNGHPLKYYLPNGALVYVPVVP